MGSLPKLEVGARTLRGKLAKLYPEFLVEFPELPATKGEFAAKAAEAVAKNRPHDWDAVIDDAVARGAAVPEVSWAVPAKPPREPRWTIS